MRKRKPRKNDVMKWILLFSIVLCACNPLRHYQKVALDNFRNIKEKQLLSKACNEEFPLKLDSPTVTVSIDSAEYNKAVEAYNALLDEYLQHMERDTSKGTVTIIDNVRYKCTPADSARILRNFLKTYRPAPIVRTIEVKTPVEDSRKVFAVEQKLKTCADENQDLSNSLTKKSNSLKNWKTAGFVMGGALLLLLVLLTLYLTGKIGKK